MNNKVEHWLTVAMLVGWTASIGSMVLLSSQVRTPDVAIPKLTPPATAGTLPISDPLSEQTPARVGQGVAMEEISPNSSAVGLSSSSMQPDK